MSVDADYVDFVAYLSRPKSVDDWSDTSEILERHVAALVASLGGSWTCEGPVDEADSLFMTASRRDGDREETIWFSFDYLDGAATLPRAVPDPMRFDVRVQVETPTRAPWMPVPTHARMRLAPLAFASIGAIVLTGLFWRASGWPMGWIVPSLALALALIGIVVARSTVPAWVGAGARPTRRKRAASPELLALAAAVERYLRASFGDVHLVDDSD
ncbi:MAG TPA: hypothetical protein VHB97_10065 [Polyangia bacterium]|jgi:hypothetical protein|nr:hypothetical protein [Polyangia bacterium]